MAITPLHSRIRQARLRANLSQEDLARRVGTTGRNVARWEKGSHQPRTKYIAALAEATGNDVGHFLSADGDDDEDGDSPLSAATLKAVHDLARALRGEWSNDGR